MGLIVHRSRGMLKMKIQAMCWVTSSKEAIFNVKHNSDEITELAHPARVPTPTPIFRDKYARGQKFRFLNFEFQTNHLKAYVALISKMLLTT